MLVDNGYSVEVLRILASFVETFGLTLHPFDLATNNVMAGRLEAREWIDVINCHQQLQSLGYLFWAACSKDPGFSPASLLNESRRRSHYSAEEISQLSFSGPTPDAAALGSYLNGVTGTPTLT